MVITVKKDLCCRCGISFIHCKFLLLFALL